MFGLRSFNASGLMIENNKDSPMLGSELQPESAITAMSVDPFSTAACLGELDSLTELRNQNADSESF
jgi:hypothetical protein